MASAHKTLPWISLLMLLTAYASVGRFLAMSAFSWITLTLTVTWILLLAVFFMSPLRNIRTMIYRSMGSDRVAFLVLVSMAALAPAVLAWWHIFLYFIVIVGAEALARMDIQAYKFNSSQAFFILSITSLMGLGLGWLVTEWFDRQPASPIF